MSTTSTGLNEYAAVSTYELLRSAARGLIGIDQRLIHALADDPARSVSDMLRFASEDHENDPVQLEPDLIAVFRYLRTPEAVPFYIRSLREGAEDDDIVEALIELGAAALEPLLELYEELQEEQREDVAFALAGLGVRDQRILDALLERLEYDPVEGAMALGVYGDLEAIPAIEKMLESLRENESELRAELMDAVDDLKNHTVDHSHPDFDLFGRYPEHAGPDFEVLGEEDRLALLDSESDEIRAQAARSFGHDEFGQQARARLLQVAKTDPVAKVRGRAWEALGTIEDPEIKRMLRAVALDSSVPVDERGGALLAVALEAGEKPDIHAALEALYNEPGGRARALEAMWGSLDRTFAKYFPPHLEDPDHEVLVQAIFGTGYLGIGSEAERLAKYFDREDLRKDALLAYALAVPAEISRGRIHGLFRKVERVAGGLTLSESSVVQIALDQRLMLHGLEPVFYPVTEDDQEDEHVHGPGCGHDHDAEGWAEPAPPSLSIGPASTAKPGRNEPCPCGSGKKYKKCCGA